MISSKFCIDFFFRYNSKVLITPIPEINFEEFNLLLLKLSLPNSFSAPLLPDKYQELLYICLINFQIFFDELLNGQIALSEPLENLISRFKAFINVELKAISVYNEAKLFLFKEIDYMTLTYRRLLNFLQDLDQYIVKVLKRQALLDLFHKAFSQFFQEIMRFQAIFTNNSENPQTHEIFLRIKAFLSEKLMDINEIWASDSNRKLINEQNSENLSLELNETPNKFDKKPIFQASTLYKDQPFFGNNDHNSKRSLDQESQIEIEFKNLNFHEETPIRCNKNMFDETFLPLKESNFFESFDDFTGKAGKLLKSQTKTLDPKTIPEESKLNNRPKGSMSISQNNNKDEYLDPKNSFRKFYIENTKYQVKTKEKYTSLKKMPSHIQVNGVFFIDPLFLLDQENRKEDFSLFNDLNDEDIDENYDSLDQSVYQGLKTSSMESKAFVDDEIMKQEIVSPLKRTKKKKVSSKIHQKPLKSSLKGKSDKIPQLLDISPHQQKSSTEFTFTNNLSTSSQLNIKIPLNYNNNDTSSDEDQEKELSAASPLVRRHNFLKKTFIDGGGHNIQNNLTVFMNPNEIIGDENSNIDVMLTEPEILKAISLSCAVRNNHSSVFFSKWVISKEKRKKIQKGRARAQKRWGVLQRIFQGFSYAKRILQIVKNFDEFIRQKVFRNEDLWFGKVMMTDGLILIGKGTKQGQGEGEQDFEGEFVYALNRKIRDFGKGGAFWIKENGDLY